MEIDNLCTLKDLDSESILSVLKERYESGQIYTNAGLLLLSINPFAETDLFGPIMRDVYRRETDDLKPHIYALVDSCLSESLLYGECSIVISGESGSGKTETARHILDYMELPAIGSIDCILEAFGNAKTPRNSNSSRFGKLIELKERVRYHAFLLEKSRVTNACASEQENSNFHIFYYVLAHRGIELKNDYISHETNANKTFLNEKYNELNEIFRENGIEFEPIEEIILGILYLGSIEISENSIVPSAEYDLALSNLKIKKSDFENCILRKELKIAGETIYKNHSDAESKIMRDSLARSLYQLLFDHILRLVNARLDKMEIEPLNLNILDIFGFESFDVNGLDQFCINWCNERIYDTFVQGTFNQQKALLVSEGVVEESGTLDGCAMKPSIVDKIEMKCGIADLVSEESIINGNIENLAIKLQKHTSLKIKWNEIMELEHFAGKLDYHLKDFLAKNREKADVAKIMAISSLEMMKHGPEITQKSDTVIESFRKNQDYLFSTLNKTRIKYIKCIKPNDEKLPFVFDAEFVQKQLLANGIMQAVELSKSLFSYSLFIDEFDEQYRGLDFGNDLVRGQTRIFFNNRTFKCLVMAKENYQKRCEMILRMAVREYVETQRKEKEKALDEVAADNDKSKETIVFVNSDNLASDEVIELLNESPNGTIKNESKTESRKTLNKKIKEHEKTIKTLLAELGLYKAKESDECAECKSLERKYNVQSQELLKKEDIEKELERLRKLLYSKEQRPCELPSSPEDAVERLLEIFLAYIPLYSGKDIPKDEIHTLAHALFQHISPTFALFPLVLEVLHSSLEKYQDGISGIAYILSNCIELRILAKEKMVSMAHQKTCADENAEKYLSLLDEFISILFNRLCIVQSKALDPLIPGSVLDYQHLKEFRVKESIYKKIFACPSITKLLSVLEHMYNIDMYYYLPDIFIMNNLSFIIGYIDYICFNSLISKKKFLNPNRCLQINYNLSEIEKFCYGIRFHYGFYNMAYMREACKINMLLGKKPVARHKSSPVMGCASPPLKTKSNEHLLRKMVTKVKGKLKNSTHKDEEPAQLYEENLSEIFGNSFLNKQQINALIDLYENTGVARIAGAGGKAVIDRPLVVLPEMCGLKSASVLVKPKYLPEKALKCVMSFLSKKNDN
ncbi:myosin V [Enteropsectra breve]|nr:myosin V [Enteropsectra breve]